MLTVNSLAYHEMRIVLASVMFNFDVTLTPEADNWIDQKCHLLWAKPPMMAKLTPA